MVLTVLFSLRVSPCISVRTQVPGSVLFRTAKEGDNHHHLIIIFGIIIGTMTGFVRVLASSPGVLLLLLAIATATTTLLLQPVGASTVTYAGPTSGVSTGTTTSTTTPTDDLLATDDTIPSASSPTTAGDATDTCSLDVNEACENDATVASCMWLVRFILCCDLQT